MTHRGFTLVEMLIVIAILAVMATLAAPNFAGTIDKTRARKTADFVVGMVNFAKSEALNKSKNVYVTVADNVVCISSTLSSDVTHSCDIRSEPLQSGVTVVLTASDASHEVFFDRIYGLPSKTISISVTTKTASKIIAINLFGFVTVS